MSEGRQLAMCEPTIGMTIFCLFVFFVSWWFFSRFSGLVRHRHRTPPSDAAA
jgi:hypothetical protein